MSDAETTRAERKEQYERILRIVAKNTGGPVEPQDATISPTYVLQPATQIGMSPDEVRKRLQAGVENGDLVCYRGEYAIRDEESLRKVLGELNDESVTRSRLRDRVVADIREVRDEQ